MGALDFISTMTGHLAWPLVVVVTLILFRGPISRRLQQLRSVTAGSFAAQFGELEAEVSEAVEAEEAANPTREPPGHATREPVGDEAAGGESAPAADADRTRQSLSDRPEAPFRRLALQAADNPSYAVVASWELLQNVLSNYLESSWTSVGRPFPRTFAALAAELQRRRLITPETQRAVDGLRRLRNDVAHGAQNPEAGAATAYVQSAEAIAEAVMANMPRRPNDTEAP